MKIYGQVENVPATHPVYLFLERMETRHIIEGYHDAVLPISRSEVSSFLKTIHDHAEELTGAEREYLSTYLSEFQYEVTGELYGFGALIGSETPADTLGTWDLFENREKFLYLLADSNVALFFNGLLTLDVRSRGGDELDGEDAEFIQFGGRFRGTVYNRLGYYLQGTNAQFWGSRSLLRRDPLIRHAHTINVLDTQNFDFVEGYVRYANDIFSAQVGRERVLWGLGADQQMVASANVPVYDFIRADAQYKSLRYTFIHAWILGTSGTVRFSIPSDTSTVFNEPVNADKYFAAHRLGLTFPKVVDVGFQEVVVYGNRGVDLAYLNPVTLIESVQRSRGERDNVLWVVDLETHFLRGMQLSGTFLFDDIHFGEFFEPRWYNRYAYQGSLLLTDPLFVPNTNLIVEYTRVEPFTFSHNRSREATFSSGGSILGPRIGPNADAWYFRIDWLPAWNVGISLRTSFERSGENVYDAGILAKNVGGDILVPHRPTDPENRVFLDGILMKRNTVEALASYEFVNQLWLDGWYLFESMKDGGTGTTTRNHTFGARLRTEL
jgi:hypothetical protein